MQKSDSFKFTKKEIFLLILMAFFVFAFRSSVYEPYRIPSGSMIPTLQIGDFILVNKYTYGFKVPFSDYTFGDNAIDFNPIYLFGKSYPKRGDIVVFKFPTDPKTIFIKRVIGLPGEEIEIKNKIVYINDKPLKMDEFEDKNLKDEMDERFKGLNYKFYHEKIENHQHVIQINQDNFYHLDFNKVKIPQDKFFVMGDNRDDSYDSRSWGMVAFNLIKGKAVSIWFSLSLPFGESKFHFRPERIGTRIN